MNATRIVTVLTASLLLLMPVETRISRASYSAQDRLHRADPGIWRLVIIPDTQVYMKSDRDLQVLTQSFRWIEQNHKELHIQGVFQVGDIVDDNSEDQWVRARRAFSILQGKVPVFYTTGNHDHGAKGLAETRETRFNDYLPLDSTRNLGTFLESFERGRIENAAYELKFAGEHFLIVALEFGPRDEVIDWAARVVQKYPSHRRILLTHEYMDMTSSFLSRDGRPEPSNRKTYGNSHHYVLGGTSSNNGQEIWKKLVHRMGWFEWVFSGHYDYVLGMSNTRPVVADGRAFAYRKEPGSDGRSVHQIMFNAQWIANGGDGWMLMIEGSTAHPQQARLLSYSAWLSELGGQASSTVEQEPIDFAVSRSP